VHPYNNILLPHYRVPQKTVKFVPVVPKANGSAIVCAYRKSIKQCNLKNVFGAFYRGWYVVVHPYSNFSICRQMALVYSIKFQTVNFPIFCTRIIVIFWTTCIAKEIFFLFMVMGNVTHILPVLHRLEVVIAFVSSLIICLFICHY